MAEDIRNMESTEGVREFEKQFEKPYCVVLDSEYGSMGRMIGYRACEMAGYTYYDAATLLTLVPEENLSKDDVDRYEQKLRREMTREEIVSDPEYQRISAIFDKAVDRALAKGSCLIHDRATREMIEQKGKSVLSVFNYATDKKAKIVRASLSPLYKDLKSDDEFLTKIHEEDLIRINYHKAHSDTEWGDTHTYDLCLNAEKLGRDYAAWVLGTVMKGN